MVVQDVADGSRYFAYFVISCVGVHKWRVARKKAGGEGVNPWLALGSRAPSEVRVDEVVGGGVCPTGGREGNVEDLKTARVREEYV